MKKILICLINLYRKYISPLKGTKCPYYPSCSEYGLEAVKRYGAFKGSALSLYRIIRCNPLSKGGTDPVPESNAEIKMRYFPHIRNEEHI